MELNLERPLLFFDIESTGLNIPTDGIIELSFVKVMPGGEVKVKTWKIKPWDYQNHRVIPINPQASEVNGVKDEDLVDCPKFIEVLPEVAAWLENSDLAGFNSQKFDLPLLAEEIERVRAYCQLRAQKPESREKALEMLSCIEKIDLHACRMVDVQNIFHKKEQRTLVAAYKFYVKDEEFNAHAALDDTKATYEVLQAQLDYYPDLKNDIDYLSEYSSNTRNVDLAGRIVYNDNNEQIFNFGKYKGHLVTDVLEKDPGYYGWIMASDFPLNTKQVLTKIRIENATKK